MVPRVSCACFPPINERRGHVRAGRDSSTSVGGPGIHRGTEVPLDVNERRIRALVVDDDLDIAELVRLALTDEGHEVVIASNGSAALELALVTPFDLILLDMRMPVMDGCEFVRAYRTSPEPRAPVVVVTAARDAAERAAEINADGHLAKPFGLEELLAVVELHARRT